MFRLKGENEKTEHLLKELNKDGRIHVVPAKVNNKYIIRFIVTSYYTTEEDIRRDWEIIKSVAYRIIGCEEIILNEDFNRKFQSSLLLSNVPQTPKIVNASFVAFFDSDLNAYLTSKDFNYRGYTQSHLPLTPRRRPKNKSKSQFFSVKGTSLDQLASVQSKMSLIEAKYGNDLILDEKLEDSSNEDLKNQGVNGENGFGMHVARNYNKQLSLDSKIERIFEIAANELKNDEDSLNMSQPNSVIRRSSKEMNRI